MAFDYSHNRHQNVIFSDFASDHIAFFIFSRGARERGDRNCRNPSNLIQFVLAEGTELGLESVRISKTSQGRCLFIFVQFREEGKQLGKSKMQK